ncbi:MAG: hypothetical protein GYB65_15375, partial [Chloroflexi bacterium]|nr:hypothetical protein [Chloroflexota bacterium]
AEADDEAVDETEAAPEGDEPEASEGSQVIETGTISYGQLVEGTLEGNTHTYTFSGASSDIVTISLESDDFNPFVELLDANGESLAFDNESGPGLDALISIQMLPADGTYTIVVSSLVSGESGDYELYLALGDMQASLDMGDTVTGTLDENVHFYFYNGEQNEVITISLTSDDFDTYLELYDSDATMIVSNDDGGEGLNSQIDGYSLPNTGSYAIVVRGYGVRVSGDYTLALGEAVPETGDMAVPEAMDEPADDAEPEAMDEPAGDDEVPPDEPEVAPEGALSESEDSTLRYGDSVSGSLDSGTARYSFTGTAGDVVSISLESGEFDTYLELLAANGQRVARDDDSGTGLNAAIIAFELPSSGEYTIIARGVGGAATGDYTLTLVEGTTLFDAPLPDGDDTGDDAIGDDPETDQPVENQPISYGDTVIDFMAGNSDTYVFSGTAGDTVTISMESADLDSYLELLDADGNTLIYDDDGERGLSAQITAYELPASGDYTIVATTYNNEGSGDYRLRLSTIVVENQPLAYGDEALGMLRDNVHLYSFSGTAGNVVTISLTSNDFDTYLVLKDTSDNWLTDDDDGGDGLNAQIAQYELPTSGQYTVIVRGFEGAASGDYSLTVVLDEAGTGDEPGDENIIPAEGGPISYGQTVTGNLAESTHSYTFSGTAGDVISVGLNSDDFDTYLELLDNTGERLTVDDDGGLGYNSYLAAYILPYSGEYTIIVRGYGGTATGSYTLALVIPAMVDDNLTYGSIVNGTMTDAVHLFQFMASEGDTVTISLESDDFDTYLELLDPGGVLFTADDDGGDGLNSLIDGVRLPAAGTYTIIVRGYEGAATGDYTLSLSQ